MLVECKVQWIKGLDIVPKGAAEGEDEGGTKMHNYAVQQGEGIKILPFLTRSNKKISLAFCNYLSLELKNF